MASTELTLRNGAPIPTGMTARDEFGAQQLQRQNDTAMAAVTARETAMVQAEYIYAERHPRAWMDVRREMLDHCARPRFAETARYAKPIGKEKINGEWVEKKAKGFSARFAETLAQEMGNVKPISAVTYEDESIRITRIGVTDLQKNVVRHREVTFAKAVEKRGKQNRKTNTWEPPEGREVLSQRLNSYNEPTYLCRATEDEMRSKVNSEESKTQRDFILKLCPRDILEECEEKIADVVKLMSTQDAKDPLAAVKKLVDRFHEFGIQASDLETYIGRQVKHFTPADIQDLRELGIAIKDNQITFQEALRLKYSAGEHEEPSAGGETEQQHDARLKRQMDEQARAAEEREKQPVDREMTPEENRALDEKLAAEENPAPRTNGTKLQFGGRK